MLSAPVLRWFYLTLFLLSIGVQAKTHQKLTQQCDWYCWVEEYLDALTKQVDNLSKMMGDSSYSPPGSSESTTTATIYKPSSTFWKPNATPNSYDASAYSPSAIEIVSPTNPNFPIVTTPVLPKPDVEDREGRRAVAYFGNWDIYARKSYPQNIPTKKLTHLLYSFADNKDDGTVFLTDTWADTDKHYDGDSWSENGTNVYGAVKQLGILKQKNRNLKVMLSVGGWTYTNEKKHLDPVGASAMYRKNFADSCVDMVKNYGFDGIDVDWEYPQTAQQGSQFLALLQAIRQALNDYADFLARDMGYAKEAKPHFLLSIAAPAGEANYEKIPLNEVAGVLDFMNLMAYDYAGSWDNTSGHASNLSPSKSNPKSTPFNTDSVIKYYLDAGVPSSKLNLGMPLYGRAFASTDGLGQSYDGVGEGDWEKGVYDLQSLPLPGSTVYLDKEAKATYSYDNKTKMLISFDTVEMALTKADYIKRNKLGGAMWWEVSGDRTDNGSIITNVVNSLSGSDGNGIESKPNWLYYPDSSYDNIKTGFAA